MADFAAEFDIYANTYRREHALSTGVSESELGYFAEYKIAYLEDLWRSIGRVPSTVLDFGSGIGNALRPLRSAFPKAEIVALDVSRASLDMIDAQAIPGTSTLAYDGVTIPLADNSVDCIFTACVFHHIPAVSHMAILRELRRVLRDDGMFVLFEHNPANPLTRQAVARCEFDRDAVLISAPEMRQRVEAAGFSAARQRYCLFFPTALGRLRPLERLFNWLPFGAQYHIIGR